MPLPASTPNQSDSIGDKTENTPSLVATVILNYNGKKYLEQFLPAVTSTTYPNQAIIIADNASTDDSLAFLETQYPTLQRIILKENYGFAGGYNAALQQVAADYYILLNSDVEVTPNWIEPIIELMEQDSTIAACQPKVLAHYDKKLFEHAGAAGGWIDAFGFPFCRGRIVDHCEEDKGQYDTIQEVFWATGAALVIRKDLYQSMEGLDADYFAHMEEIDLCWRLKRAGYKIMVQPASTVYHVGGGTLNYQSPRKTYLNFRNNLVTIFKNEPTAKLFWLIPIRLTLDGLAGMLFFVKGQFANTWQIIKAHGYFYKNFFKILAKRKAYTQLIEQARIQTANEQGRFKKSMVFQYYLFGKKTFNKLIE